LKVVVASCIVRLIYATSRLERCFRDVHVVTHHHMVSASNTEMVGQYLLGFGLQAGR